MRADKGKGLPRTGHEGPEGEQMYSCTLPSTSALDGGGWSSPPQTTVALPPGKTRHTLYRRLDGPQGRSGRVRKILPPTGIRSPDRPARSKSLYRLSYPGPSVQADTVLKFQFVSFEIIKQRTGSATDLLRCDCMCPSSVKLRGPTEKKAIPLQRPSTEVNSWPHQAM